MIYGIKIMTKIKILTSIFKEKIKDHLKSNEILINFLFKSLHNESICIEFGNAFDSINELNNELFSTSIFEKYFFLNYLWNIIVNNVIKKIMVTVI